MTALVTQSCCEAGDVPELHSSTTRVDLGHVHNTVLFTRRAAAARFNVKWRDGKTALSGTEIVIMFG